MLTFKSWFLQEVEWVSIFFNQISLNYLAIWVDFNFHKLRLATAGFWLNPRKKFSFIEQENQQFLIELNHLFPAGPPDEKAAQTAISN